jgi:hypothetical protein
MYCPLRCLGSDAYDRMLGALLCRYSLIRRESFGYLSNSGAIVGSVLFHQLSISLLPFPIFLHARSVVNLRSQYSRQMCVGH